MLVRPALNVETILIDPPPPDKLPVRRPKSPISRMNHCRRAIFRPSTNQSSFRRRERPRSDPVEEHAAKTEQN